MILELLESRNSRVEQLENAQPPKCQEHPSIKCDLFCETCSIPLCDRCIVSPHDKQHSITNFDQHSLQLNMGHAQSQLGSLLTDTDTLRGRLLSTGENMR